MTSDDRFKELYSDYCSFMRKRKEDPITFDEFLDQAVDLMATFYKIGKLLLTN